MSDLLNAAQAAVDALNAGNEGVYSLVKQEADAGLSTAVSVAAEIAGKTKEELDAMLDAAEIDYEKIRSSNTALPSEGVAALNRVKQILAAFKSYK